MLLVEDNHSLANTLVDYLELEDIACDHEDKYFKPHVPQIAKVS